LVCIRRDVFGPHERGAADRSCDGKEQITDDKSRSREKLSVSWSMNVEIDDFTIWPLAKFSTRTKGIPAA
jgi:hypothetical protein